MHQPGDGEFVGRLQDLLDVGGIECGRAGVYVVQADLCVCVRVHECMSVCVSVRAHARISVCVLFWYVVLQLNGRTYDDSIVDCIVIVRSCAWKQEFYVLVVHVVRENAQI